MITIIGIAGKARVGKTTFADALGSALKSAGIRYRVAPLADRLKDACPPREGERKEDWRPRLIEVGNNLRALHGPGHLAHAVRNESARDGACVLIVPDVRIPEEADVLLQPEGCLLPPLLLRLSCDDGLRARTRFGPTLEQSVTAYWRYQKKSAGDVTETGLSGYGHSRVADVLTDTPEQRDLAVGAVVADIVAGLEALSMKWAASVGRE